MSNQESRIRIKLHGLPASEWSNELQTEALRRASGIRIVQIRPPVGQVMSLDPAVASAIIQGAATVVAALVGAAATIYVALRTARSAPPSELRITLIGANATRTITTTDLDDVTPSKIEEVLTETGDLRECEVHSDGA